MIGGWVGVVVCVRWRDGGGDGGGWMLGEGRGQSCSERRYLGMMLLLLSLGEWLGMPQRRGLSWKLRVRM